MANLLSTTTIGGYQSIHSGNIGSYAITSLSGYATQSWVQSQGYLTSVSWSSITGKPYLLTLNYDQGSSWAGNTGGSGRNLVASFHGASGNSVITFGSNNGDLNLSVDGNVYVNEGQDILASRTWVTSQNYVTTSGNAATSTTFSTGRTNYKGVTDSAVAGQLMWKNYGNNHTIFDASQGTSPDGTSVNNTNSQAAWTGSYPTLMGWNGSQTYGVRVDSARVADTVTTAPTVYWNSIVGKPSGNTGLVQFGDFINQPTFAGKTLTMHPSTIKTLLWGGNGTRYTVTTSTTGTYPQAGSTYIITYELIDGSNSVYSSGNIYCGFWNNCPPTNITVRVQNTSGTWYGPYQGSNIGVGYFEYWRIPCGGPNFIKAWEITFTPTSGCNVALMTVDIVIDNNEGIDQDPFVSRGGSSMLGNLTLSGGATLNLTGSAHKYLAISPGNGYEAMIRYNGGSGTNWYVGKRTSNQLVGTESFHFYSEAAGQTVAGIDTSGNSFAIGSFRAPVFYDSNDTSYYGNFNGTSVMSAIRFGGSTNNGTISGSSDWGILVGTDSGWIRFGPANSSYAHIYTDRATFYFNKDILVNGNSVITTSTIGSQTAGSVTGLTLTSSANNLNPDNVTQNQIGYNTSVSLFGQTDGGLYSSAYSSSWIHQIYGDFRSGQIAVRGKNNGTWQSWRTILDSGNYTSYSPSLTGSGASGTWGINVTGSAGSVAWTNVSSRPTNLSQFTNDLGNYGGFLTSVTAHTHSISDITDAARWWNNMGQNHSTQTDFNSVSDFGFRYIQGNTNGPGTGSAQFYGMSLGLGNDYAFSSYALQLAVPRYGSTDKYISFRTREAGTWQSWNKISAGYADSAGSVAWTNVSSRPTALSSFTNDSGFITSYSETDTLSSVVARGNTTSSSISTNGMYSGPTSGRMFIGDVGHGTSYPAIAHENQATTTGYALLAPNNGYLYLNKRDVAGTYIGIRKANSDMVVIDNDGNVGVNTASPSAKIHIKGASSTTSFLVQNASSENVFAITADKNIGILTASPAAALDIAQSGAGGSYNALFLRAGNPYSSTASNQILFGYSAQTNYAHVIKTRHNSGTAIDNTMDFYIWKYGDAASTSGGQHVMTLSGNGNMGVGKTAPTEKLDVDGVVNATGYKVNGTAGYNGTVTIIQATPNPPKTFTIVNGIITNVT
jgi:hypothetical protein